MKLATNKDIHKWFRFLNSWKVSDEPKMLKQIHKRQREILRAEKMSKGLPKPIQKIESCDCTGHILKIEDMRLKDCPGLSFRIYDVYSSKEHKLKKSDLIADVVIMNNTYPKEYDKLMTFLMAHFTKVPNKFKKDIKSALKSGKPEVVFKQPSAQGEPTVISMTNEIIPMKWYKVIREDGRIEYTCEHGVGHSNDVHGCCGYSCCMRKDFPLNKGKK